MGLPDAGDAVLLHQRDAQHELVHVVVLVLLVHDEDRRVARRATMNTEEHDYNSLLYTSTALARLEQLFLRVWLKSHCWM